jgi:glycosyltransferase involved in cell wall biosynthesis
MKGAAITVLMDGRPIREPISGVAQYVCNLAVELDLIAGVQLDLFTLEYLRAGPLTEIVLPAHAVRHMSKCPRKLFNIAAEHLRLPVADAISPRADLIHHTFFAWLPSRRCNRVVSTIHDVIPIEQPTRFTKTNAYYANRNFLKQARESDAIIAVSEYTKERVVALSGIDPKRVEVIPNGVRDLAGYAHQVVFERLARRWGIRTPFLLYIGNIEERKGVPALLEAYRSSPALRQMQLVIAGRRCWGVESFEAQVAAAGANILLPGYVSEAEKAALLRHALMFVYPSTYEGFGIPIVEAMQCGCPVVTANNSSLAEIGAGACLFFETGNVDDLRDKMERLVDTGSVREQLRIEGYNRAKRYSWRVAAEKTAALYRRVVNGG